MGFAARRERDDHIAFGEHAQVAVQSFHRMHKQRRGSSGTERRGKFPSDQPDLSHARDDHSPGTAEEQFYGAFEGVRHRTCQAVSQRLQSLCLHPDYIFANIFH